jgi:ABC-2 type transport system ATP-binding protein
VAEPHRQEVLDALAGIRGSYDSEAEKRLVNDYSLDTRRKIRTYSKGNRQKVMLVAAFAARTELLVLDEPTSGLDPLMEEVFQTHAREAAAAGRAVLLSSHILGEVERLCEAVTIIKEGRLVESGLVSEMRHLAMSTITGQVSLEGDPGGPRRTGQVRIGTHRHRRRTS